MYSANTTFLPPGVAKVWSHGSIALFSKLRTCISYIFAVFKTLNHCRDQFDVNLRFARFPGLAPPLPEARERSPRQTLTEISILSEQTTRSAATCFPG